MELITHLCFYSGQPRYFIQILFDVTSMATGPVTNLSFRNVLDRNKSEIVLRWQRKILDFCCLCLGQLKDRDGERAPVRPQPSCPHAISILILNGKSILFCLLSVSPWDMSSARVILIGGCNNVKFKLKNGNFFRVTGPLCREFTGHRWIPRTKASDAELLMFSLISAWIISWLNNREAGDLRRALIMMSL